MTNFQSFGAMGATWGLDLGEIVGVVGAIAVQNASV